MSKLIKLEDCVINTEIIKPEAVKETLKLLDEYETLYKEWLGVNEKWKKDEDEAAFFQSGDLEHLMLKKGFEIYTPIVSSLLGNDYKAVYWSPAWGPCVFTFSEYGKWTFVDKVNLKKEGLECFNEFIKPKFVRFDITKTPDFPKSIKKGNYDLAFFNKDWAGGGSTYRAADLALRKEGLLMTRRLWLKDLKETFGKKYSVIFYPGEHIRENYVILLKKKD